jgi:regulator of sirC expression with transglutaminase-like and TPR domain
VLTPEQARARFAELAAGPESGIRLAEGAILIAAEEGVGMDPAPLLGELDRLAAAARPAIGRVRAVRARVEALARFLYEETGFHGNESDYYDPANSFLDRVLERRMGIPITLATVWIEVGARLELPLEGVGFPGHFLVRAPASSPVLVDPFTGAMVDAAWCETRLKALLGPKAVLEPHFLRAATPRQMLARMLANLKQIYSHRQDYARALACSERILLLAPDSPLELRDRGLLYEALECFGPALADLERFLVLAPEDESAAAVREQLPSLRAKLPRLH